MKNNRFPLITILIFLLVLIVTGCPNDTTDYYDYAGIGVSGDAFSVLNSKGFTQNIVYSGNNAVQLLAIVTTYPASNSNDTYYKKKTYEQLINWLNRFRLPHTIATLAKNSITAFCYYDVKNNLWAVFAEDVSDEYRSITLTGILEDTVIPKDGYQQKEIAHD
ncbi:MAG: hypothetical protein LBP60_08430 [Spirochaetaceae bacterium]|jgi:hypothetical protein|nr:hypothetical protein [Spirochaetaceae bacterium]